MFLYGFPTEDSPDRWGAYEKLSLVERRIDPRF